MDEFNKIYGQDLAIQILKSSISKKHISTAYLFSGPEGVGRKKTAKVFIQSILNTNPDKEDTKRKIENNNHPDLLFIEPSYMVQGKSISQEKAKLESINIKSPAQIRLNQIKEIIEFLAKKPLESERSIVIIEDIEKMNESASNALLKTLEEPNAGLFILITQRPEKLLSTIRSRCQIVPFLRLNDDQVSTIIKSLKVVQEINDITKEKVKELIAFSYGSPGRYLTNIQYWLGISNGLREKLEMKLTNQIEVLKLAKEITDELDIDHQLWLINFQQNRIWEREKNSTLIKKFEQLRQQLISYVQPRLAWEVALLEINFIN
ncbi:DNA polymerase III subunit delta' [Prochlorococcus marinus]|uniref:DNA polymerase III subunit delta n=1 Tax=Prochlorococcus marinus XMU1408 TaxID=2213228 RepID=A0A318R2V9_PROMR|nr:DNA polymerase III subunit delta' [Prochlorococcus marinus]MBW3041190.1 DNA polymerase III subunit delta' [Prochlorococcus marinus str. XMU1408]PYE03785.1 DNA polymerase III subunit delta' [Prochlorococcus marinus XMU1408]